MQHNDAMCCVVDINIGFAVPHTMSVQLPGYCAVLVLVNIFCDFRFYVPVIFSSCSFSVAIVTTFDL
jgi:hypothetical protein